jgi:hypothetical protein
VRYQAAPLTDTEGVVHYLYGGRILPIRLRIVKYFLRSI